MEKQSLAVKDIFAEYVGKPELEIILIKLKGEINQNILQLTKKV